MNTPTDYTRYQQLVATLESLIHDAPDVLALYDSSYVQDVLGKIEAIKNRNGGFPPGRPFDFNDDEQAACELAVESGVR